MNARSRKTARRAKATTAVRSQRRELGAESTKSRWRGRARHSRGSIYILGTADNDQRPAVSTNGAGIAESAADVGWDTPYGDGARNGRPTTPWLMARVQARARDRGSRISGRCLRNPLAQLQILSKLGHNYRDVHHWILGVTGPISFGWRLFHGGISGMSCQ